MLFQNKLQVSRSQVLQSFWSALMTTKFWKNPKKKKTISDWSKRRVHHTKVTLPIKKTARTLIWFWQFICPRVEMMRKKVYFDIKLRNHTTMAFCSRISIFIFFFGKSFNFFFKDSYWIFQICEQLCSTTTKTTIYCTQCKQFTSSWLTNVSVAEFWRNRGYYMAARR